MRTVPLTVGNSQIAAPNFGAITPSPFPTQTLEGNPSREPYSTLKGNPSREPYSTLKGNPSREPYSILKRDPLQNLCFGHSGPCAYQGCLAFLFRIVRLKGLHNFGDVHLQVPASGLPSLYWSCLDL